MALLEIPLLNKSAFLKLKTPNLNVVAVANFLLRLMIFPTCFLPNAIKRDDKVVEEIFWHQKMKKRLLNQTLKIIVLLR